MAISESASNNSGSLETVAGAVAQDRSATEISSSERDAVRGFVRRSQQSLWVCSGPFFETLLFFYCTDRSLADETSSTDPVVPVSVDLYDSDGERFNTIQIFANPHRPAALELDPFMGGCKIESGLRHAHAVAHLPEGWRVAVRMVTREGACVIGPASPLTVTTRAFFPVVLSKDRFPLVVLLNTASEEATVRARLFCGKRSPEAAWVLPARGARVMSVAHEFGESLGAELDDQVQAYLRLGVRGEYQVDAYMIERLQGPKEGSLYVAIS